MKAMPWQYATSRSCSEYAYGCGRERQGAEAYGNLNEGRNAAVKKARTSVLRIPIQSNMLKS